MIRLSVFILYVLLMMLITMFFVPITVDAQQGIGGNTTYPTHYHTITHAHDDLDEHSHELAHGHDSRFGGHSDSFILNAISHDLIAHKHSHTVTHTHSGHTHSHDISHSHVTGGGEHPPKTNSIYHTKEEWDAIETGIPIGSDPIQPTQTTQTGIQDPLDDNQVISPIDTAETPLQADTGVLESVSDGYSPPSIPFGHKDVVIARDECCRETIPPDIKIIAVNQKRKQSMIRLVIDNNESQYVNLTGWSLELRDVDNEVKLAFYVSDRTKAINYLKGNSIVHFETDTEIVLLPSKKRFDAFEVSGRKLAFLFPYRSKRIGGYQDSDVFVLLWRDGREITRYPEPIAASPIRLMKTTTTWAEIKRGQ